MASTATDRLRQLEMLLRPAILSKDHTWFTNLCLMVGATYTTDEVATVGAAIIEAGGRDVQHFWLEEDCPCGGDPFYHQASDA